MNNIIEQDPLLSSEQSIALLEAAARNDAKDTAPIPGALCSEYSVISRRNLPVSREQAFAGQIPVVAIALAENPSKAFEKALSSASAVHKQVKKIQAKGQDSMVHRVSAEYQRLVNAASERVVGGDVGALDDLESEADIHSRFEAERAAVQSAVRKLGHSQIQYAVVIREELDNALAALAKRLETRDAEECKEFGIKTEYSVATRLVQAVRITLHTRTHDLDRYAQLPANSQAIGPIVHAMFSDHLDLSGW